MAYPEYIGRQCKMVNAIHMVFKCLSTPASGPMAGHALRAEKAAALEPERTFSARYEASAQTLQIILEWAHHMFIYWISW
jgi:hypothetical protein